MPKRQRADSEAEPDARSSELSTSISIPRRWLIVHAALAAAPWAMVAALWPPRKPAPTGDARIPPELGEGAPAVIGRSGAWGRLELSPIVISPPLEYIPLDTEPPRPMAWFFPGTSADRLQRFLEGAGVERSDVGRLIGSARVEPRITGVTLAPEPDVVRRLSPAARGRVYLRLAESELNPWHQNAFRFYGASVEEWLGPAKLTQQTRERVRPLVYALEGFRYFADFELIRPEIKDPHELRRLTKALFREATFVARLRLTGDSNIDEIAEYWGRGGRSTDIRPLLESLVAAGPESSIDITHLLPPFARAHLYRYPMIPLSGVASPKHPNCFWTAMNFFNREADDRFLDLPAVLGALKRDYFEVHDRYRLGDVVLFQDGAGDTYHAAVYVADGLVFGKNGKSVLAPWTFVPVERIKGYYTQYASGKVAYFRRKNI